MSRQVYLTIIKRIDLDNDMFNTMCAAFALIQTALLRTKETATNLLIFKKSYAATVQCIALHIERHDDVKQNIRVKWFYHRLYGWKTWCWPIARPPLALPLGAPRGATGRPTTTFRDHAPTGLWNPLQKYVFCFLFFVFPSMLPRQLSTRVDKFL